MARAKVTIEALTRIASVLKQGAEDILSSKSEMDRELDSFEWDDHVAITFKRDYYENLKPITDKMLPVIKSYLTYLESLSAHVYDFTDIAHGRTYSSEYIAYPRSSDSDKTGQSEDDKATNDALDSTLGFSPHVDDSLPPYVVIGSNERIKIDKTDDLTLHKAAIDIRDKMVKDGFMMAGLGLVISSELMLRKLNELCDEKTNEIFYDKYNTSLDLIANGLGPETDDSFDAFDDDHKDIHERLIKEVIEIKKKEVEGLSEQIEKASERGGFMAIRESRLNIDKINLEREINVIETGEDAEPIPYEKTYIAGLTEKEMSYLMDHGNMSPGRFANMLEKLKQSNYEFDYEDVENKNYSFYDIAKGRQLIVAHDGSSYSVRQAIEDKGCSSDVELTLFEVKQSDGQAWYAKKPSELKHEHSVTKSSFSVSANMGCSDKIEYNGRWCTVGADGGELCGSIVSGLGLEIDGGISGNPQGVSGAGEASIAKGEIKGAISSRQIVWRDKIYQVSGEGTIGGTLGGSVGAGVSATQGTKVNAEASALLKGGMQIYGSGLSCDELPPSIAKRLFESLPTLKKTIFDDIPIQVAEIDLASSRINQ